MATLLSRLPELRASYVELVQVADGDPGAPVLFGELAEEVADLARDFHRVVPTLFRYLAAIEHVARTCNDAEELVGWAFLDTLSPDEIRILEPILGAWTRAILRGMEQG